MDKTSSVLKTLCEVTKIGKIYKLDCTCLSDSTELRDAKVHCNSCGKIYDSLFQLVRK